MRPRLRHADLRSTAELRCRGGHPLVLRCHPLRIVDDVATPFPTLFWLACPHFIRTISRLEHDGWIGKLERLVREDEALRAAVHDDHRRYAEERHACLSDVERERLEHDGLAAALREVGIGGIRNYDAVKCLHLHYAHHLARGSTIGRALDDAVVIPPCQDA